MAFAESSGRGRFGARWAARLLIGLSALAPAACDDAATPSEEVPTERTWTAPAAGPDARLGLCMSVWGPGPDTLYAVGGQPQAGAAWRFDGTAWQPLTLPDGPLLNWVHGAGDVLWMVGDGGRALRSRDGGASFEAVPTGTDQPLWGVWAANDATVWAVGGDARTAPDDWAPVLLKLTADAFETVPLPTLDRTFAAIYKVWGSGPDDVIAVGARGVLLHYDGTAWAQVPVPGGLSDDLISVWGQGAERVVVAGGRNNGVALAREAGIWRRAAADALSKRPGLNGVWVAPDGTATLVGVRGAAIRLLPDDTLIRDRTDTSLVLHAVFGVADREVAVGGSLDSSPPWTGLMLEVAR